MKLSEAIRLGSMLHPQTFERYWSEKHGTCALGAAASAISKKYTSSCELEFIFPLLNSKSNCPVCSYEEHILYFIIIHLNDYHRWTREAVADFIEEIENGQSGSSSYRPEFDRESYKEKLRVNV